MSFVEPVLVIQFLTFRLKPEKYIHVQYNTLMIARNRMNIKKILKTREMSYDHHSGNVNPVVCQQTYVIINRFQPYGYRSQYCIVVAGKRTPRHARFIIK